MNMSDKSKHEAKERATSNLEKDSLDDDFELGEPITENDLEEMGLLEINEEDILDSLDDMDDDFNPDSSESVDEEDLPPEPVHAFVANMTFPKTLSELTSCVRRKYFDIELLQEDMVWWTMPKYAREYDIVFFMHAASANQTIKDLEKQLKGIKNISEKTRRLLQESLDRGKELYKRYGGKIFAVGFVVEDSQEDDSLDPDEKHWSSNTYAGISGIRHLNLPVDISEFRDFLSISRFSSITKVRSEQFDKLLHLIKKKNPYLHPNYLAVKIKDDSSVNTSNNVFTDQAKGECPRKNSLIFGYSVVNGHILNASGSIIPDAPVTVLPLSVRTNTCLSKSRRFIQDIAHEDIMVSDLLCQTRESLSHIRGMGAKSIRELIDEIEKYLYRYDDEYIDLEDIDDSDEDI